MISIELTNASISDVFFSESFFASTDVTAWGVIALLTTATRVIGLCALVDIYVK